MLSEDQIKAAPDSDYMNEAQLEFFKQLLLDLYGSTSARIEQAKQQMATPIDLNDENDRASMEEQNSISLRIFERDQRLLPKIQQSLKRIREGEYGYCLESGDPIGIPRLLLRPTAEYCAEVKAIQETKEKFYRD
ncbi:TraR/DksA C4-type zinc finger protein [uncultured Pseudoteredinibacter sp.]|uniref:TraR/DksA family transcriptional regulator n=1 Tax=uncultured Pseudoteredinibacter sp. TaxID=1641701 RepID=UPI002619F2C2|nr:TraR/DksA C4-type zinc finger protein [uncultured Pseudoteredinibacter sp.]